MDTSSALKCEQKKIFWKLKIIKKCVLKFELRINSNIFKPEFQINNKYLMCICIRYNKRLY